MKNATVTGLGSLNNLIPDQIAASERRPTPPAMTDTQQIMDAMLCECFRLNASFASRPPVPEDQADCTIPT